MSDPSRQGRETSLNVSEAHPMAHAGKLPNFASPPVAEVAVSVQFDPLESFEVHHIGQLWTRFKASYPQVESHPPVDPVVEVFQLDRQQQSPIRLELLNTVPMPRVWFLNAEGTELIQVQRDRFVVNWRRVGTNEYPRFPHIRDRFERDFATFSAYVSEQKLGEFRFNQCEVNYFNQIEAGDGWSQHGEVGRVLNVVAPELGKLGLQQAERFVFSSQYLLNQPDRKEPVGRLHVVFQPAFRAADNKPIFVMNLTARGKPLGDGFKGALAFIDFGRSHIVRAFEALTTSTMHKIWGQQ